MVAYKSRLKEILDLSTEISQTKDIDLLLESILTKARAFTGAEAGSIYIKEHDRLRFKCAQNDVLQRRLAPGRKLIYTRFTIPIDHASIAGYVATTGKVLYIKDAYHLPPKAPYAFDSEFDKMSDYRTTSILTVPLNTKNEICGVLQVINAKDRDGNTVPFPKRVQPYIVHFANSAAVAVERAQLTRSIILRMIKMAELHDPRETGSHVNRVAGYAVEIYEAWAMANNVAPDEVEKNKDVLRMAAMMHDIGEIGIPDTILKKPGRLDPDEFDVMKTHAVLGAGLFSEKQSDFDDTAFMVALNHHQRWDGKGYPGQVDAHPDVPGGATGGGGGPQGKGGEEIPLFARIVSIADVYDALRSVRRYKEAFEESRCLEVIRDESGRAFDPDLVEAFFSALPNFRNVLLEYPDPE